LKSTDLKKVAIIGAGASGLLSSIILSRRNFQIDIFEQNIKVAKKILASGNGRCNISNTSLETKHFFGKDRDFVKNGLKQFGFKDFQKFADSISLYLDIKDDGKVYPLSNEAKSVAHLLEIMAKKGGVNIFLESFVEKVWKNGDGKFQVQTSSEKFQNYDYLIVATGSNSASHLGGNMSGYKIAESFKHKIELLYPSLAQLQIKDKNFISKASGVKLYSIVKTYINGNLENTVEGDLLFTKYGVSGFSILDSSQIISQELLKGSTVELGLDLIPKIDIQELENMLFSVKIEKISVEEQFLSLLPQKLFNIILENLNIKKDSLFSELDSRKVKKLVHKIKDFRLTITETNGFKGSEVTGGGVDTGQVNPKTMESKIEKNLYFTGEVLDIIGKRGGYNLHFAWASGYLASQSIVSIET